MLLIFAIMGKFQDLLDFITPSFLSGSLGNKKGRKLMDITTWRQQGFPRLAGNDDFRIDKHTALTVSYVYAAINGISTDIASLDWSVVETSDNNVRKELRDHDQHGLLNDRAYFLYTSTSWMRAWLTNRLSTGDGFSEIVRDRRTARPIGYRLWHKKDIIGHIDHENQTLVWEITAEGEDNRMINDEDMLHLGDMSYDGIMSYSPIGLAAQSIEISKRSDATQKDVHKEGTFLGGVVQYDQIIDDDQLEKYRRTFNDIYRGSKGDIAALDGGAKFTPFTYSMNLADAEFITSRQFTGEEILRFYRYPKFLAGDLTKTSFNNIEQLALAYINYTLRPIVGQIENELNNKLIRKKNKRNTRIVGNMADLLRGDIKSRMLLYDTLGKVGALSPNDIRILEGMNPVKHGDYRGFDLNTVPQHLVDEYFKNKMKDE